MALQQQESELDSQFLIDSLFCEEEAWIVEEEAEEEDALLCSYRNGTTPSAVDLFWEDEELVSLFSKEKDAPFVVSGCDDDSSCVANARRGAVEWMLRVNAHYGFSALTAVLGVNYLDRFLPTFNFQQDKPWMMQLTAVTCLSLAAKVEETQVPLLLDLQVEDAKYVFEPIMIQRMEIVILKALQWRMNPVTPLSFLDHIITRLGLKNHSHWEFLRRSQALILSLISDWRFVRYLPSVLATSTMLHVIHEVEPCNSIEYQDQLMGILKISQDQVKECSQLIHESTISINGHTYRNNKRKFQQAIPSSPNGIFDASFSCENSNESWAINQSDEPLFKKSRAQDQQMRLPYFNRVFVDVLNSP